MILSRVRRTLRDRALLCRGERVLVACSGGPDSAALLHVLSHLSRELSLELSAASVDHGLRPDAGRDVETAAELARGLDVPFVRLRVEIPSAGSSVQRKARRARYGALLRQARECAAQVVAVGHTRDDQAETVLARILRGSGARGISGIDPHRADGVIRPLIDCARAEVHAYVAHHGLPFVEDPSNENSSFLRVRLRREILPRLAGEDPRIAEHLADLADDARALRSLLTDLASALLARAADGDGLRAELLADAHPAIRAEVLSMWVQALTGAPAQRAHLEELEHARQGRGHALLPGALRAILDADGVLRARLSSETSTRGLRRSALGVNSMDEEE